VYVCYKSCVKKGERKAENRDREVARDLRWCVLCGMFAFRVVVSFIAFVVSGGGAWILSPLFLLLFSSSCTFIVLPFSSLCLQSISLQDDDGGGGAFLLSSFLFYVSLPHSLVSFSLSSYYFFQGVSRLFFFFPYISTRLCMNTPPSLPPSLPLLPLLPSHNELNALPPSPPPSLPSLTPSNSPPSRVR